MSVDPSAPFFSALDISGQSNNESTKVNNDTCKHL